jgi:hypothetical protein
MEIIRHHWQPNFPDEIVITDDRKSECFEITLKQGSDIEITFDWDYGYGGRGNSRMTIPVQELRDLLNELETQK